ncbi:MAG: hypothetical protein ACOCYB_02090 [Alkalispirochaeta sp.]
MTRSHRPGRRVVRCAAILLTVTAASGGSVFAQWMLNPVWSDVTPGRVTVEPWGVESGTAGGVVLVTEDRWIRVRDAAGTVVTAARSGLREPVGVLHEGPHHALLIPPGPGGFPLVRVDLFGSSIRRVGRPASGNTVIPADARSVVVDGESLIYSVSPSGLVTHASAAGGILWSRRLPARPTAVTEHRGAVYVALNDGRLFQFDGTGTGEEVLRMAGPIRAMAGTPSRSPALVTLDREGTLTLVDVGGDRGEPANVRWEVTAVSAGEEISSGRVDGPPTEAAQVHVAPGRGASESWYAVVTRPGGGAVVIDAGGDVQGELVLPDAAIDEVITGRMPSGGFLVVSQARLMLASPAGTILDQVELRGAPERATWIAAVNQLIVTYPDWSIDAWEVASSLDVVPPLPPPSARSTESRRRAVHSGTAGSLTARAEAVLAGTSRSERSDLLADLVDQRRRAVLFDRVGEARDILRRLVREPWRSAVVQDGSASGSRRIDFPGIRRDAVAELGRYMDRSSRDVLTDVVRHDPDYYVVATALRAFASYGVDEAGVTGFAVARFRSADERGRQVLAPAMIDLLELSSVDQRHPHAAEAALDLLIESNLARDIRRRAATIARERLH